jgi:hypothetical protein
MDGLRDDLFRREEDETIVLDESHIPSDGENPSAPLQKHADYACAEGDERDSDSLGREDALANTCMCAARETS